LLDASALIALVREERGGDAVEELLEECAISAVNLAEVLTKLGRLGWPAGSVSSYIEDLQIPVLPITQREAEASSDLCHLAWENGISLGDRLCLATCLTHNLIAVTSEQNWPNDKGVTIRRIR